MSVTIGSEGGRSDVAGEGGDDCEEVRRGDEKRGEGGDGADDLARGSMGGGNEKVNSLISLRKLGVCVVSSKISNKNKVTV